MFIKMVEESIKNTEVKFTGSVPFVFFEVGQDSAGFEISQVALT